MRNADEIPHLPSLLHIERERGGRGGGREGRRETVRGEKRSNGARQILKVAMRTLLRFLPLRQDLCAKASARSCIEASSYLLPLLSPLALSLRPQFSRPVSSSLACLWARPRPLHKNWMRVNCILTLFQSPLFKSQSYGLTKKITHFLFVYLYWHTSCFFSFSFVDMTPKCFEPYCVCIVIDFS